MSDPASANASPQQIPRVVVRRSARRTRTVSARREGDSIVVMVPARMSAAEEARWVDQMVAKVMARQQRSGRTRTDEELQRRAERLARDFLDPQLGTAPRPRQVRWVSNQNRRWGSCTPQDGTIRLSDRMQSFPEWVVDHVLLHELVHLVEQNHTPRFHRLLAANPKAERAEGFLHGFVVGQGQPDADPDWEA